MTSTESFRQQIQKVGSSDMRQRALPSWIRGVMFVAIGGLLALTLARWTILAGLVVVAGVLSLTLVCFIQKGARPSFSLKTILLVTGLVACGIVLKMTGDPWKEVHRFPGYEMNVAMSPDGELVVASQGTSIVIRETQTGRTVQTIKMTATEAATKVNQRWTFKMGFTLDGKSLMTVDWQTYPSLFNVANGEELRGWSTNRGICSLAASGSRFVSHSVVATSTSLAVETCNVYDVELVDPILTIESISGTNATFSPSGDRIATIYAGFLILDGSTGEFLTGGRGRSMGMDRLRCQPPNGLDRLSSKNTIRNKTPDVGRVRLIP